MKFRRSPAAARRGMVALTLMVGVLLFPAAATALPPTITSAGQTSRHLTASWTLPPGMATDFIEAATSPAKDSDGYFLTPYLVLYEELADGATTYTSALQFPAGKYYVHVAAYDPTLCVGDPPPPECIDEFSSTWSVTIPADPPSPPPPPPPPPPDTATAFAALTVPKKQDVDKLTVAASMGEAGTLTATGTVSVPGASKVYKFKTATANAAAGVKVKLKLKLPKKALKAVKKALKRHKKVKAKLTITAKDTAGNTKVEKRTVALKP
jgi:hypothetical protein